MSTWEIKTIISDNFVNDKFAKSRLIKRKCYENISNKFRVITKIYLSGYSDGRLSIMLHLDENNRYAIGEVYEFLIAQFDYKSEYSKDSSGYFYLEIAKDKKNKLIEFIEYLHISIDKINPKSILQDMMRIHDLLSVEGEEEIYTAIADAVALNNIEHAVKLAAEAVSYGCPRVDYTFGAALHNNAYLEQALKFLSKVTQTNLDDYHHANELMADITLSADYDDAQEKFATAFRYLCKAGDSKQVQALKSKVLDLYCGGNGLTTKVRVDVTVVNPDTILLLAKESAVANRQLLKSKLQVQEAAQEIARLQMQLKEAQEKNTMLENQLKSVCNIEGLSVNILTAFNQQRNMQIQDLPAVMSNAAAELLDANNFTTPRSSITCDMDD